MTDRIPTGTTTRDTGRALRHEHALAVAHAVQCPYCIDAYTQDCQQKGADIEQMTEALHVAVAIRGGASLVHGMQMREKAGKLGM